MPTPKRCLLFNRPRASRMGAVFTATAVRVIADGCHQDCAPGRCRGRAAPGDTRLPRPPFPARPGDWRWASPLPTIPPPILGEHGTY